MQNQPVNNMTASQPWQQQKPTFAAQNQPLSEKEISFDLLYNQRDLMNCVTKGMEEASTQALRQVMQDTYRQLEQDQLSIFSVMQQQGFYQTKPADAQDLATAKQKFQQMRASL